MKRFKRSLKVLLLRQRLDWDVLSQAVGERPPYGDGQGVLFELHRRHLDGSPVLPFDGDEGGRAHGDLKRPGANDPCLLEPRQLGRPYLDFKSFH